MRITDQTDIDTRQAKDDDTYAKRTQWALKNLNRSRYDLDEESQPWKREVGRMRNSDWYVSVLRKQATRLLTPQ